MGPRIGKGAPILTNLRETEFSVNLTIKNLLAAQEFTQGHTTPRHPIPDAKRRLGGMPVDNIPEIEDPLGLVLEKGVFPEGVDRHETNAGVHRDLPGSRVSSPAR